MSEITLADLMNSRDTAAPAPSPVSAEELSREINLLSPEDRALADEIKSQIDVRDSQMLMQYGSGAKQDIADFSGHILGSIRTKDSGYAGQLMADLVTNVESLDYDDLEKDPGIFGLFQKAGAKVRRFLAQYQKLEVNVDRIEGKLEEARMQMLKDIGMFDSLYEKNLDYFRRLQVYITAGEEKLEELREKTIPSLRAEAQQSGDPMHAQLVRDFEDSVNQFEKKVHDLKTSKTIAIQTAPQIRLVQNNDTQMVEKIQSTIVNTIPLWKSQMVLALGVEHSAQAAEAQRQVTDMTNELLKKNAEKLKMATVETAKASERGIVDMDTLKATNESLISTLDEVMNIQREGREKRAAAETELRNMETELKNKLLQIQG